MSDSDPGSSPMFPTNDSDDDSQLEEFYKRVETIREDDSMSAELAFSIKVVGDMAQKYFICKEFNDRFPQTSVHEFLQRIIEVGLVTLSNEIFNQLHASVCNVAEKEIMDFLGGVFGGEDTDPSST